MSAAETLVEVPPETLFIPRKVWTRAEVSRLSLDGLSLELVNGDLIDRRMGKNPPHKYWHSILRGWFIEQFGNDYVRSEESMDVAPNDNPINEPEPDLAVTTDSLRVTRSANPDASNLRLVIEVSDTTFKFDSTVKAELYARAGIGEFWVLDVRMSEAPRLLVHRDPANGLYRTVDTYSHTDSITVMGEKSLRLVDL